MAQDEPKDPPTGDLVMALARRVRHAHVEALADRGAMCSASATEVVDALEDRGWVRREPDPTDRRATRLVPTPDGRRLVDRIDDVRRDASQRVLDVLTPAQRRTLHEILAVVVGEDL